MLFPHLETKMKNGQKQNQNEEWAEAKSPLEVIFQGAIFFRLVSLRGSTAKNSPPVPAGCFGGAFPHQQ